MAEHEQIMNAKTTTSASVNNKPCESFTLHAFILCSVEPHLKQSPVP